MEILKSIFGLAKNNNGFFKSEKQAKFLTSVLEQKEGFVGYSDSGFNSCPIFAKWDSIGLLEITKHRSTKKGCVNEFMFQRKVDGVLSDMDEKEIKRLERKIKKLKKNILERQKSFNCGNYNSTMDISTYTVDMIERFNRFQEQRNTQLISLKNKIQLINYGKN